MSFRLVAVLPALLLIVFGAIWLYDRSQVDLSRSDSPQPKNSATIDNRVLLILGGAAIERCDKAGLPRVALGAAYPGG